MTAASAYDTPKRWHRRVKRVAANTYRYLICSCAPPRHRVKAHAYPHTHPGCRHDCIFLICDDCGQATHIDDDRLTGALREAGQHAGFADVRPVVELRGLCGDCAG